MLVIALILVPMVVIGPLLLALAGRSIGRGAVSAAPEAADWRLSVHSALLHCLAFTLIFLLQELFLVLPKAVTPGLHPVLFHNNHDWTGDNPVADLLQGTGALGILIAAMLCAALVTWRAKPSLFLLWIVFQGIYQSLPQIVVGALFPPNDVGRAMAYLALSPVAKGLFSFAAMGGMAGTALWLAPRFMAAAHTGGRAALLHVVTLPAFASLPLVLAFRVPGDIVQVAVVPLAVTVIGTAWVQAAGWRAPEVTGMKAVSTLSPVPLLIGLAMLLAFFQLVLRPGVAFG